MYDKEETTMTDDYLVRHCAPTLAGIKTASLFTCPYDEKERLLDAIRRMNQRLRAKGLRVLPLRFSDKKALIYLYRPARLSADLRDGTAEKILRQCGYPCNSCGHCVVKLVQRLREQEEFPHEIGLFLGYPPEDVAGFIQHKGQDFAYSGYWKVYVNERETRALFDLYADCTQDFCLRLEGGASLPDLVKAV
jgi:hypothetical protein